MSAALRCHKRRFCTRGYKHFGRGGRCKVREREMRGLAGEASEWARVESGAYAGEDEPRRRRGGGDRRSSSCSAAVRDCGGGRRRDRQPYLPPCGCGRRFHLSATRAMHEQACRKGLASRMITLRAAAGAVEGCDRGRACGRRGAPGHPRWRLRLRWLQLWRRRSWIVARRRLLDWIASNDLPELRSPGLASGDAWRQQQQDRQQQQQQQQPESDEDDAEAAALLALLPPKRDGSCVKSALCDRPHRHRGRCNRHRLPLVDALRCKREREREEASHNAACAQLERDDQGGYDRALSSLDAPLPAFFDTLGTAAPSLTSASAASSASSESAPSPSRVGPLPAALPPLPGSRVGRPRGRGPAEQAQRE